MTRLHSRFGAALAGAVLGTALLSAPVAAVTPITFSIYINGTCQYGTGQANTNFTVRLNAPNGDLVQRVATTSSGTGNWQACFSVPGSPGEKVRATGGGADRTVTIPNLTMKGNRVTDVVSGKWKPSTSLSVCVTHYVTFDSSTYICLAGTSSGTGSYSVDFTAAFNVRGGDYGSANYTSGSDYFSAYMDFPYMEVRRADPFVEGSLNNGQAATLTLETGSSAVRGSASVEADYNNFFDGYFFTSSGNLVLPRAADKVVGSFASDATITIPDISVDGVALTDVVNGTCLPNRPYMIYARRADYSDSTYRYGTTDGSGHFSQDLTADINLVKYDPLQLTCLYSSGDRIFRAGSVTS